MDAAKAALVFLGLFGDEGGSTAPKDVAAPPLSTLSLRPDSPALLLT